jgi:hypothetical protein
MHLPPQWSSAIKQEQAMDELTAQRKGKAPIVPEVVTEFVEWSSECYSQSCLT